MLPAAVAIYICDIAYHIADIAADSSYLLFRHEALIIGFAINDVNNLHIYLNIKAVCALSCQLRTNAAISLW